MPEGDLVPQAEARFDAETTRRIVALAGRLQSQQVDSFTYEELRGMAAEAGIEPRYIDASIAALRQQQPPLARTPLTPQRAVAWVRERWLELARKPGNRPFLNAAGLGALAWLVAFVPFLPLPLQVIAWVALGLALLANDARAGGFRRGFLAHLTGHLTLILLLAILGPNYAPVEVGGAAGILAIEMLPTSLFGGLLGAIGAHSRKRQAERAVSDRQEMLRQFYDLRDALIAGTQPWAFLSVDVAGSTALKSGADPLAVEYTFSEFDRQVAEVVERHRGRIHSTAGDGALCAFPDAATAFAAAQTLQQVIPGFNQARNRLGRPLAIRAGIHAGVVVAPEGDISRVQFSHVLDVAAHLQKAAPAGGIAISEEAARQVGVIPGLSTLPEPVAGCPAYVWLGDPALPGRGSP
jgi:class 3 adenylate cyclase